MNLRPIKANMTEVRVGKYSVLFSYETPVAYHEEGVGYAKTNKFWSKTTSKHINLWLKENGYNAELGDGLREVNQETIDNLLKEVA